MNFSEMLVRVFTLVVEASIAATILTMIAFAVEGVSRKRLSPAWRFAIYLPVLLRLVLPIVPQSPASILNFPQWMKGVAEMQHSFPTDTPAKVAAPVLVAESAAQLMPVNSFDSMRTANDRASRVPTVQYLAMFWLAVSVILLARLGIGALRLNRRIRRDRSASPELIDLLENLRIEFGSRWRPRLVESAVVQSPCLFGLFRPKLLLPIGFRERLTRAEMGHVMLHELGHLKRGDLAINGLMVMAQAVHWFNPFVWLLFRRMRLLRELACDRMVLEMRRADLLEAKAYGETLLKLIDGFSSRDASSATIGIVEDEQSAKARLLQIAKFVPSARRISATGLLVILVLLVIGLSNAQTPVKIPPTEVAPALPWIAKTSEQELKAKRSAANIEALEREYDRAKQEVDLRQTELEHLTKEFNIPISTKDELEAGLTDGSIQNATNDAAEIQQRIQKTKAQLSDVNALLEQLKKLPRKELRKALPTSLQPPDEPLNRLLGDYSAAEQKYALLSGNFSDGHPEVATAREVLATINRQIEDRIDGILMGLEVRKTTGETILKSLLNATDEARAREAEKRQHYMPFFKAKRSLEHAQRHLDAIFVRLLAEKVDAKVPASDQTAPTVE